MESRGEEFQFNLTLAGRPAGSQRLSTQFERGLLVMRLEAQFQGPLGSQKRVQISKLEPSNGLPTVFTENDNGRVFETSFDRRAGLVKLRQNRDEAFTALTQDYQDPLSILHFLRGLPDETRSARVPMIGGTVLVTRLEDQMVDSPWGPVLARVYYLRPGVSFVYVEAAAPHRLLKLTQSLGKYALEAQLTRASEGPVAPLPREERRGQHPDRQEGRGGRRERPSEARARRSGRSDSGRPERPEGQRASPAKLEGGEAGGGAGDERRSRRRRNRNKNRSETNANEVQKPRVPQPQTQQSRAGAQPAPHPDGAQGLAETGEAKRKRRRRVRRRGGNAKPSEE